MAPLPPRATMPLPSSGSTASSTSSPPAAELDAGLEPLALACGADHDGAVDRKLLERLEHPRRRSVQGRRPRPPVRASARSRAPRARLPARSSRRGRCGASLALGGELGPRRRRRSRETLPGRPRPGRAPARRRSPSPARCSRSRARLRPGRARRCSPGGSGCRPGARGTCPAAVRPSEAMSRIQKCPACVSSFSIATTQSTTSAPSIIAREHAGDEVNALDHHRPALLERAVDRRLDADEDVARLLQEPVEQRVDLLLLRRRQRPPGVEARVVDRRQELRA